MRTEPSPHVRFFGYAMMAVGVLITLLSGACTGVMLFINLASVGQGADPSFFLTVLGVGVPFILIGVGLFVGGRAISRGG